MPPLPSCGRRSPLVPDKTGEVVGEIGHADLRPGTGDADRAHEQPHPRFLLREDMLDEGADLRAPAAGPRCRLADSVLVNAHGLLACIYPAAPLPGQLIDRRVFLTGTLEGDTIHVIELSPEILT